MINIRLSQEKDTKQLEELFLVTRQQTFYWESPNIFKIEDYQNSVKGEVVFVAEESDQIIGFISVWVQDRFIHNLFIRADYQNRGIGKKLIQQVIEIYSLPLELKVLVRNEKAVRFYERQGWKKLLIDEDEGGLYYLLRLSHNFGL